MASNRFFVRFWGVRGSLPVPDTSTVKFGGNTSCVEIRCGDHVLVFDAGSGIHPLGNLLIEEEVKRLDLFFTHAHYDHIGGLPFFAPFHSAQTSIDVWSGHRDDNKITTRQMVKMFMKPPFFPVRPEIFKAKVSYNDFIPGDGFNLPGGIAIRTLSLNHPGGSVGYKIRFCGKTICYITDTEHIQGGLDQEILRLIQGADIVIYDATYCDEEFKQFIGFGHSTWQEGIRLCEAAGVRQFCIFHHHPSRDDAMMSEIENQAQKLHPNCVAAREGMRLDP